MKKHLLDRLRFGVEAGDRTPIKKVDDILYDAFTGALKVIVAKYLGKEPTAATLMLTTTAPTDLGVMLWYDGEYLGMLTLDGQMPSPENDYKFKAVYTFIPDTYRTK